MAKGIEKGKKENKPKLSTKEKQKKKKEKRAAKSARDLARSGEAKMGRIDGRATRSSHLPVPAVLWIGLACLLATSWPLRARAAGALETVAQNATQSLGTKVGSPLTASAASVVVAAPLLSDDAAPKGDELALRVAALVAGRIGAGARAHPQTAQLGTARAVAGRASALVYVQTAIAKGDLRTTIDVYPSIANAWDRIRNPLAAPSSHAFASAKIDAEVRSFLTPLLLEQASVDRARHDEGDVLAAACGDVDGDGGNELVLVSRSRVALGRIRARPLRPGARGIVGSARGAPPRSDARADRQRGRVRGSDRRGVDRLRRSAPDPGSRARTAAARLTGVGRRRGGVPPSRALRRRVRRRPRRLCHEP